MSKNQTICDDQSLGLAVSKGAHLVMFGAERCGVCKVIWPQLLAALDERWPSLKLHYIDCEKHQENCAQQGVYSLPVVRLYFDGRLYLEKIQVFSLGPFISDISKLCEQYSVQNEG
ncbi:thioredoxin family protein [Neptunomonas japonica]|uniref:Thioredoxin domain-containing protein n=1 Tax=Neptunomonas japonica JAMM 1380 TaxID=1441457 RepID=A0A7R6PH12_9GAMM|nr:thioredoxin domain-containing protein [Neptunomonas japonica]BBB29001.1 conserved hypothetical protein [Neptunomonas japonica JAMM 1380]